MAIIHKTKARRPAGRKPVAARARKRPARRRRSRSRAIHLEQRHLDVLGLGLVALGVLLGFVLYGHWDGGRVGDALAKALAWLIGEARLGFPVAVAGAGALLLMRPLIPTVKPFRAGAILLFAASALALAGNGRLHGFWSAGYFRAHGGILGQSELWVASRLV